MARFDAFKAIRFTPLYVRETDWPDHFDKLCVVLEFRDHYPTAKEFVTAVWKWQVANPPGKADGILGAKTWKSMQGYVMAVGKGGRMPSGPLPDWLIRILPWPGTSKGGPKRPVPQPPPPSGAPEVVEDRVLKEMAEISFKQGKDAYTAYPVSGAYLARQASIGPKTLDTGAFMAAVATLRVGDVWPGMKGGTRIILGLAGGFRKDQGEVLFITDSGRAYTQTLEGWHADYMASFWADLNRSLAPIETLLEVYAEFLLGAISATHPAVGAWVFAMGALQWIGKNRKPLAKMIKVFGDLLKILRDLRAVAPTLHDKVVWELFKNVLAGIPASTVSNPKIMARLIGQMVVNLGIAALKRDPTVLVQAVKPLAKLAVEALATAAKAVGKAAVKGKAPPAAVAALKGTPGAIAPAAKQLAFDLLPWNISLAPDDAVKIVLEILTNPQELEKQLGLLTSTCLELVAAVAELK